MAKKKHQGQVTRLTVLCSDEQESIINSAVEKSKASDRSTWMLAHAMLAAQRLTGASDKHAPILITGDLSARLHELASAQGISAEQLIQQLAITA